MAWYKGNLHCHTTNSDGKASPSDVCRIYKENGYHFLCLTDHNFATECTEHHSPGFITIPGVEHTVKASGIQVHVNSLGSASPMTPDKLADLELTTVSSALQKMIDTTLSQNALPMINHPNWLWSFGAEEISKTSGAFAFEVLNGGTSCNSFGCGINSSTDQIWDRLLTRGMKIFGTATDDAHWYALDGTKRKDPPFTGWVCVEADRLEPQAILDALQKGHFYSSNLPQLKRIDVSAKNYAIQIERIWDETYVTDFVGMRGNVVATYYGYEPVYKIKGDEKYIRAKITSSTGHFAWTQPYFL